MEVLIAIVIVAAVAAFVSVPLRRGAAGAGAGAEERLEADLAELEARKQAKYREIRDTELDHASGKLGDEDFRRQDSELRADAIAILKQIDALEKRRPRPAPDRDADAPVP